MTTPDPLPGLFIRIRLGEGRVLGPGKAELLERIAATGSIAGAARAMGMSYKRAWSLIETLNAMFDAPLVQSARGGPGTGGAALTDRGKAVLAAYRAIEDAAAAQTEASRAALQSWLARTAPRD